MKLEPVQKRAKRTREKILRQARKEFSRYGFHGSRIDRIARLAQANRQRIYAYFGNKRGLFSAVLQEAFEEIGQEEEALQELEPTAIPHLPEYLIRHYFQFHRRHPHFWRLLSWANLEEDGDLPALRGLREPGWRHLRVLYEAGQARGVYRRTVRFETFVFLTSAIAFFYFSNQKTMSETLGLDLRDPAVESSLVEEVLAALRGLNGQDAGSGQFGSSTGNEAAEEAASE